MDLERTKEIKEWTTPGNLIEFKSFMGLAGYYMIFIREFQILITKSLI
jgi:hypothetical protein